MFRAFCVPQISVYYFILNIGHLLGALILYPPKIKSAPTEVGAQKTQTPIVAKPTEKQEQFYAISSRNLHFYQIHYGHNAKRI